MNPIPTTSQRLFTDRQTPCGETYAVKNTRFPVNTFINLLCAKDTPITVKENFWKAAKPYLKALLGNKNYLKKILEMPYCNQQMFEDLFDIYGKDLFHHYHSVGINPALIKAHPEVGQAFEKKEIKEGLEGFQQDMLASDESRIGIGYYCMGR